MNAADVIQIARRDWRALADSKAAYWSELERELGPGEGVRIGDELRRYVQTQNPDWPSDRERALDLETHVRVTAALQSVAKSWRS